MNSLRKEFWDGMELTRRWKGLYLLSWLSHSSNIGSVGSCAESPTQFTEHSLLLAGSIPVLISVGFLRLVGWLELATGSDLLRSIASGGADGPLKQEMQLVKRPVPQLCSGSD
jgi:hypothetical protein